MQNKLHRVRKNYPTASDSAIRRTNFQKAFFRFTGGHLEYLLQSDKLHDSMR